MTDNQIELKKKWKRETSAGGIVYKREADKIDILLINPRSPNYGPAEDYWTFPKGLLDHEGESKEQVAVREVREEGGVNASIKAELGYIQYFRKSDYYGNAIKFVHFYLMEYLSGNPEDHDNEVAQAAWFNIDEVLSKLKYPHDKEIFERAVKKLT